MKALLLLAHGSRSKKSNLEVINLAEKIKNNCSGNYDTIHPAFLELSTPTIPEGIKLCVDDGASSIVVLPYFLNSGRHVLEDIPNQINEIKKYYPNVSVDIAPHIGASKRMVDVLMSSIDVTLNQS
jgi:sirohydrochlorin ferrochelatase